MIKTPQFLEGHDKNTPIGYGIMQIQTKIKQILDSGNPNAGMTWYYNDLIWIYKWIDYALQNNPNIKIFISIPPIDFPADWQQKSRRFWL